MTRDEAEKRARALGVHVMSSDIARIADALQQAAKDERDACARACLDLIAPGHQKNDYTHGKNAAFKLAAAIIRARDLP